MPAPTAKWVVGTQNVTRADAALRARNDLALGRLRRLAEARA
jgi:hypothetical protein